MEAIDYATDIVKKLRASGHVAYFAGGWVRDYLMRHPSSDIDIATDAPPNKVLDLFPHTILVGLSFGVVIVTIDGHQFEVATFRKDFGHSDGRKPDKIEFTDPQGDAFRRDFTINGMFYDPLQNLVHDYVQGAEDLERGIIRAIGNPYERFLEDRLRMIRAVRFSTRFAFSIHPETNEAIIANADALFPSVAKERIWMEFKKMAEYPRFDHALTEMHRLGLLPVIFPQLQDIHLNEIKDRVSPFHLFPSNTPPILFLCELFPAASLEELTDVFQMLHVSNNELKWVESAWHARKFFLANQHIEAVLWAHFYAKLHTPFLIELESSKRQGQDKEAFLQQHKYRQQELAPYICRIAEKKPLITSAILKECGIPPGKNMGVLLKEAERISINFDINDSSIVMGQLKNSPLWQQ